MKLSSMQIKLSSSPISELIRESFMPALILLLLHASILYSYDLSPSPGNSPSLVPGKYSDWKWDYEYTQPEKPDDILAPTYENCMRALSDQEKCRKIIDSDSDNQTKSGMIAALFIESEKNKCIKASNASDGECIVHAATEWNSRISFGRYWPGSGGSTEPGSYSSVYDGETIRNAWVKMIPEEMVENSYTADSETKAWLPRDAVIKERHNIEMVVKRLNIEGACDIRYNIIGYDYLIFITTNETNNANETDEADKIYYQGTGYQDQGYNQDLGSGNDSAIIHLQASHGEKVRLRLQMDFRAKWSADVFFPTKVTVCETGENGTEECHEETRCSYSYTRSFDESGSAYEEREFYVYDPDSALAVWSSIWKTGSGNGWMHTDLLESAVHGFIPEGSKFSLIISGDNTQLHSQGIGRYSIDYQNTYRIFKPIFIRTSSGSIFFDDTGPCKSIAGSITGQNIGTWQGTTSTDTTTDSKGIIQVCRRFFIPFTTPKKCIASIDGFFSKVTKEINCGYSSNSAYIIIELYNSTQQDQQPDQNQQAQLKIAKVKLVDEKNNSIAGREIRFEYNYTTFTKTTDSQGEIILQLPQTRDGSVLNAIFEGDFSYPSSRSSIFIPGAPIQKQDFDILITMGTFGGTMYFAYRRISRLSLPC
jgi:hypothetical protein